MSRYSTISKIFTLLVLITLSFLSIRFIVDLFTTSATIHTKTPLSLPTPNANLSQLPTTSSTLTVTVKAGDTITRILTNENINPEQIKQVMKLNSQGNLLNNLLAEKKIKLIKNDATLIKLEYPKNDTQVIQLNNKKNLLTLKVITTPLILSQKYQAATIRASLATAAKENNIPAAIVQQLEKIFSGTVNFKTQIKPNDKIAVIYDEYYKNGIPVRTGKVRIATLQQKNSKHTAMLFSFDNHQGYYDLDGKGMEPQFLKYPVKFKRISSKFSLHRMDPVAHQIRPHYGVDFAAPRGTEIHSVGDGIIVFKGPDRGYGNAIKIRYGKKFEALYAHMSRFANVKVHEHVHKGQIIGYVGMTGWATGPHLHFGWYVNGTPKDPLLRQVIFNPPIPLAWRHAFETERDTLVNQLSLLDAKRSTTSTAS